MRNALAIAQNFKYLTLSLHAHVANYVVVATTTWCRRVQLGIQSWHHAMSYSSIHAVRTVLLTG